MSSCRDVAMTLTDVLDHAVLCACVHACVQGDIDVIIHKEHI